MYQFKSLFLNSVVASISLTVFITRDQALWASHRKLQSPSSYVKYAAKSNTSCTLQIDRQSVVKVPALKDYPNLFFSPDSQTLAATDRSGGSGLVLFDLETGKREIVLPRGWIGEVSFSPDGKYIAFGANGPAAYLMNRQKQSIVPLESHGRRMGRIRFSQDSRFIATTSLDNKARVFDLNGTLKATISGLPATQWGSPTDRYPQITDLSWNSFSQVLAIASGKRLTIWDSKNGEQHTIEKLSPSQVTFISVNHPVQFIPNTNEIISFSEGIFKIFNTEGVELKRWSTNDEKISRLNFSPNGQNFAAIGSSSDARDHIVKIWNLNGSLITTLKGHEESIANVFFSQDGQCLVTSSLDNTVRLWDISGKEIDQVSGRFEMALSPDGRYLAIVDKDKSILVWKLK